MFTPRSRVKETRVAQPPPAVQARPPTEAQNEGTHCNRVAQPPPAERRFKMSSEQVTHQLPSHRRIVPLCLIAVGAVVAVYGLYSDPDRTWPSLLLNGFYVTTLALSAIFFLATQRLTGARWSASLRRI